jgi:hypothetical protein
MQLLWRGSEELARAIPGTQAGEGAPSQRSAWKGICMVQALVAERHAIQVMMGPDKLGF